MKTLIALLASGAGVMAAELPPVTFYRDVLPILQEHCQSCHRAGEIGPMPLGSYDQVRPWAKAIKMATATRRMPPWHADRSIGDFRNDPSLSQAEINKLAAWADTGAFEGDPKDAPPRHVFVEGWNIGSPDLIVEMPKAYSVPASGTIEYTYIIVPTGFKEDRWVSGAEYRPGNRALVHHATVFVRPPGSPWLRKYPAGEFFVPEEQIRTAATPHPAASTSAGVTPMDARITGYVPGRPERSLPPGYGMLIPAGADLIFQLHYTANGRPGEDRSRVGFVFAKSPPQKRVLFVAAINDGFVIPPGVDDFPVSGSVVTGVDSELIEVYPHMHLRGKSMTLAAEYPTGERETLLRVPEYEFNWQLVYELNKPKNLPKGTILKADGAFDNSVNNRWNPDAKAEVRWGDQSWEEMMAGFFVLAVPADASPQSLLRR